MRIAISGSHSLGKSTLVWDWVRTHSRYTREEEPFRALDGEMYDIRFRQECNRLHNGIQMYYNASRINLYSSARDCVILTVLRWTIWLIRNIPPIRKQRISMIHLYLPWFHESGKLYRGLILWLLCQ